jgi:thymidylate synthase (FAD)
VDDTPEFFTPGAWRYRAENKKQGSSDETLGVFDEQIVSHNYCKAVEVCVKAYESLLATGVSPEQARMVLPQSMMTSYYVTGSLAAFARMYKQRTDSHAQYEIRILAAAVGSIIEQLFPHSWKALTNG